LEAFNRTGDHQRVLDITKDVLAKAGELEEARLQRGMAYLALGNPAAARTEAEKALADNPRYKRAEVFLESIPN
jgi:Tfp pilus assembly protein PilF